MLFCVLYHSLDTEADVEYFVLCLTKPFSLQNLLKQCVNSTYIHTDTQTTPFFSGQLYMQSNKCEVLLLIVNTRSYALFVIPHIRGRVLMVDPPTLAALQIFQEEQHASQMGIGKSKEGFSVYGIMQRCITQMVSKT